MTVIADTGALVFRIYRRHGNKVIPVLMPE